jgi:hypothetical protein
MVRKMYLEIDSVALSEPLLKLRYGGGGMSVEDFVVAYTVTRKGRTSD